MEDNSYIRKITLNNFRNYKQFELISDGLPVVILGKNGIGKTNILEAISLLSPGRGIRSAQLRDISFNNTSNWAVNANVVNRNDIYNVGVGFDGEHKIIKIDHKVRKRQIELAKIINIIWLIPQMNTLFIGNRKSRLDFFDRIVFSFNPDHARNISIYEHAKQERMKLLKDKTDDDYWLSGLEIKMVNAGIKIAEARLDTVGYLQKRIDCNRFNYVKIMINGEVEELIRQNEKKDVFLIKLKKGRKTDLLTKKTGYGVHKSDFTALNKVKNISALLSSTGEQKLMTIAIILAAIKQDTILLLDDIVSHLDSENRSVLFSAILKEKCQAWITDTNPSHFSKIKNYIQIYTFS
ncbi:MAG: DNA replication/repair protein RecF [Rickettsiaceae bacterium H1]|nr:DNA replication/repair protein RecF [Rickettsiaceae bacterium H1]